MQKADPEPEAGRDPEKIALDETVITVNGEWFWLYSAVDAETNAFLHLALHPFRTTAFTKIFLRELKGKHDVEATEFFVDGVTWLHDRLSELGIHLRHETFGWRNPVERVFQEIKRRTHQLYITFSRSAGESAENWLQALAWF